MLPKILLEDPFELQTTKKLFKSYSLNGKERKMTDSDGLVEFKHKIMHKKPSLSSNLNIESDKMNQVNNLQ